MPPRTNAVMGKIPRLRSGRHLGVGATSYLRGDGQDPSTALGMTPVWGCHVTPTRSGARGPSTALRTTPQRGRQDATRRGEGRGSRRGDTRGEIPRVSRCGGSRVSRCGGSRVSRTGISSRIANRDFLACRRVRTMAGGGAQPHGRARISAGGLCVRIDDVRHGVHVGVDQLLLQVFRDLVVVEGAHNLRAHLPELLGGEVELLVGFTQR